MAGEALIQSVFCRRTKENEEKTVFHKNHSRATLFGNCGL